MANADTDHFLSFHCKYNPSMKGEAAFYTGSSLETMARQIASYAPTSRRGDHMRGSREIPFCN